MAFLPRGWTGPTALRVSRATGGRRRRSLALLPALLLSTTCGSGSSRPNVVILVLDTVRPELLSVYGYERPTTPFLESFAAQGTRFDRAYSTSSWTLPAHGSLFTGTLPKTHRATQKDLHVATSLPLLAERLRDAGFQTAGFSGNVWISDRSGLDAGFEHFMNYAHGFKRKNEELAADAEGKPVDIEQHETALGIRLWMDHQLDREKPFFLFINLVEPHLPYIPSWEMAEEFLASPDERWEAIQRYYPDGGVKALIQSYYSGEVEFSQGDWATLRKMYEGTLRQVDALARWIVESVDAVSDPENTLVFILSDHGENLGEHGHLAHFFNVYDSNLRIPFLARGPGFEPGSVDGRLVQIVDLYPTILRAAGIEPGANLAGSDLRSELPEDRVVVASLEFPEVTLRIFPDPIHETGVLDGHKRELRAAIGSRYKMILGSDGSREIYDLLEDPGEERPLPPDQVDRVELQRLVKALQEGMGEPAPTEGDKADWDTAEGLQAIKDMGYGGE